MAMKQYSILVVEDNQVNQMLLERQLNYLGYQVTVVDNGISALQRIAEGNIDLILTDIRMPGMDGFELTRELKAASERNIAHIPVIAITADVTTEHERECIKAGMVDFIAKPIDLNNLKNKLIRWTENSAVAASAVSHSDDISEQQDKLVILDISPLMTLAEGDLESVSRILDKFMGHTAILIEEIHRACNQRDNNSVVFNSHKLKSSAGSIGAAKLADICAMLESAGRCGDWDTIRQLESHMEQAYHTTKMAIADRIA